MLYVFFHDESVSFPVRTTCEAATSAIQCCVFFSIYYNLMPINLVMDITMIQKG